MLQTVGIKLGAFSQASTQNIRESITWQLTPNALPMENANGRFVRKGAIKSLAETLESGAQRWRQISHIHKKRWE